MMSEPTHHMIDDRPDGQYVTIFEPEGQVACAWITSDVAVVVEDMV